MLSTGVSDLESKWPPQLAALNVGMRHAFLTESVKAVRCMATEGRCSSLQVKLPNGNRGGALCPYCKSEFSVMFRGAQTAEERAASEAEELRVTEATLRAREVSSALSTKTLRSASSAVLAEAVRRVTGIFMFWGVDMPVDRLTQHAVSESSLVDSRPSAEI